MASAAHNWVGPQSCEIRLRQRQVSVSSRRPGLHAVFSWLCAAVPVFFGHRAQNHQSKKNNQPPVSLSHDGARGGTRLGRDPSHKLENPTVVLALRFLHSPLCFLTSGVALLETPYKTHMQCCKTHRSIRPFLKPKPQWSS